MSETKNFTATCKIKNYICINSKICFNKEINSFQLDILLKKDEETVCSKVVDIIPLSSLEFTIYDFQHQDLTIRMLFVYNFKASCRRTLDVFIKSFYPEIRLFYLNYNDLFLVGKGGFSSVFKFYKDGETYALKVSKSSIFDDYQSFIRELSLFLMIEHPNIIRMLGYSIVENRFGFVLEFAENGSLNEYQGKLSFRKMMTEIFLAMSHLHLHGIIHRDLKPDNILLDSYLNIKISDFGTSRPCNESMTGNVGTSGFMAPEVSCGSYSYSADVYSAGVVACFIFDREHYIETVRCIKSGKHVESLPYETETILRAMLSDNPEDRPTFIELLMLIDQKLFFVINDPDEDYPVRIFTQYETGNDFIYYKKSKNNFDLFHCLIFHCVHKNEIKTGEMSHLGQLLGDEYMSYIFDWIVSYNNFIAFDSEILKNSNINERFMNFSADDYQFYILPSLDCKHRELDKSLMSDYEIGKLLRKTNPELALHHFDRACKSGNIDARYQIGRIYALNEDTRCFKYLNELALSGHKKSSFYLAVFFANTKYPQCYRMINYFFKISVSEWKRYELDDIKLIRKMLKKKNIFRFSSISIFYCNEESPGTMAIKLNRIFMNVNRICGFFYLNNMNDKKLAAYYFKMCGDTQSNASLYKILEKEEKNKAANILVQKAIEGDIEAQMYCISSRIINIGDENYSLFLTNLVKSKEYCFVPNIQMNKGFDCFLHLNYVNGIYYIDNAANQGYHDAVFLKSLLAFHGHCYQKERENSLRRLIEIGTKYGNIYAFEVGIIFIQGVFVEQDIAKGNEFIKIAEKSGFEIPNSIKKGSIHVKLSLYYDNFIMMQFKFYKIMKKHCIFLNDQIKRNPIYQTIIGFIAFICDIHDIAEYSLLLAIGQDYLPAEFIYALELNNEESCDHLLKAAKGGHVESQVLIGLYYIYGNKVEEDMVKGINWLCIAASQEYYVAISILRSLKSMINLGDSDFLNYFNFDFNDLQLECICVKPPNLFTTLLIEEIIKIDELDDCIFYCLDLESHALELSSFSDPKHMSWLIDHSFEFNISQI